MRRVGPILPASLVLMLGLLGCESERKAENSIPLDQVPPAVMEAAKKRLPDVTFEGAWKETERGKTAYEVRGLSSKGGTRDVKVSEDGEVLEVD